MEESISSQNLVDEWIDNDVYEAIVKDLNVTKSDNETTVTCGTVSRNPGPTTFSFKIEYKSNSLDSQYKQLVAKVISKDVVDEDFKPFFNETFKIDGLLSRIVFGMINKHLYNARCELLRYPKLHYDQLDIPNKELLVFEHITSEGFKLNEYNKVPTVDESELVMKEYAKLHAGSIIVDKNEGLLKLCPELKESSSDSHSTAYNCINDSLKGLLDSNLKLLVKIGGLDKICSWITELKKNPFESFRDVYRKTSNFNVVNHGHIGENLLFFKTGSRKVCLSSFGGAKMGSAASDINNFLYICLDSEMRERKKQLLKVYYNHFIDILNKCEVDPPFTLDQLEKEVDEKAVHAIFGVIKSLPRYLGGFKFANKTSLFNKDNMTEYIAHYQEKLNELYDNNSEFKRRFNEIFKDLNQLVPVETK